MRNRPGPTQSGQRANRYSYGFGSPQNGTDPSGHIFPLVLGAAIGWKALGWGVFGTVAVGGGAMVLDKHQRGQAAGMSNSYVQTNVFSHSYARSMADSIRAQANRFSSTKSRGSSGPEAGRPPSPTGIPGTAAGSRATAGT
ncbi:hypothetical protein ACIQRK_03660 [Streptomyces anulatus]